MNYSEWSSHEYNSYKNDPKHYNSSNEEKKTIRESHNLTSKPKKANLNEWATLSYGGHGGPSIEGDNHGLANDRLGLVMNHLGETRTNLNKESVHEFVQDAQGWMKRMNNL
tara:strand:- start:1596 stop:1928 length:333 start_codon:yes stop_codon:yes gene_type:complete